MRITIEIDMGNDAFGDTVADREEETSRILAECALDLSGPGNRGTFRDYNGNTVGTWEVSE